MFKLTAEYFLRQAQRQMPDSDVIKFLGFKSREHGTQLYNVMSYEFKETGLDVTVQVDGQEHVISFGKQIMIGYAFSLAALQKKVLQAYEREKTAQSKSK